MNNPLFEGLKWLRVKVYLFLRLYTAWKYRTLYHMDIGRNTGINRRAKLDKNVNPEGIHIGNNCNVLADAIILSHDACRRLVVDTYIGDNTIVGIRSIVLPGVKVGSHVVIGAGSVVTKDVPDHCIVAGNPAKVIREGITVEDCKIVEESYKSN